MTGKPKITNRVTDVRERLGIPAAELAKAIGVSRQTIYAVEAGTYVPNTATGLRMARVLGVSVEELFSLAEEIPIKPRTEKAILLPPDQELQAGEAVQVCHVNGKLVAASAGRQGAYFPVSDGVVSGDGRVRGSARVRLHDPIRLHEMDAGLKSRVLLAGCDPAMGIVARHLQPAGVDVLLFQQNSSQALSLLKGGYAHIAGSHFDSNSSAVRRLFLKKTVELVSFAVWQEGLVVAAGNPKGIRGVEHLSRKDVRFVNREEGSGSRTLVDRWLRRLDMEARQVNGYLQAVNGHLAAVSAVKAGAADVCVSTEAAARFSGMDFIPLETVRYDLAVRREHLSARPVQSFFNGISELAFRRKLGSLAGYDVSVCGFRQGA